MSLAMLCGMYSIRVYAGEARRGRRSTRMARRLRWYTETIGVACMVQGKCDMPLQKTIALCGLVLTVTCGCLSPTVQGESIDVVSNPELVKYCTPKGEGKYT